MLAARTDPLALWLEKEEAATTLPLPQAATTQNQGQEEQALEPEPELPPPSAPMPAAGTTAALSIEQLSHENETLSEELTSLKCEKRELFEKADALVERSQVLIARNLKLKGFCKQAKTVSRKVVGADPLLVRVP
jgi:hypothetical protein